MTAIRWRSGSPSARKWGGAVIDGDDRQSPADARIDTENGCHRSPPSHAAGVARASTECHIVRDHAMIHNECDPQAGWEDVTKVLNS
jgi:hypothetical protein